MQAANVCDGCLGVLAETRQCDAVRRCGYCADVFMDVSGEAEHGEGKGEVTMDTVRLDLQRMTANIELVGSIRHGLGGLGDVMKEIHGRLDGVRDQMVTRNTYDSLLNQLRQLEDGIGISVGARNFTSAWIHKLEKEDASDYATSTEILILRRMENYRPVFEG